MIQKILKLFMFQEEEEEEEDTEEQQLILLSVTHNFTPMMKGDNEGNFPSHPFHC